MIELQLRALDTTQQAGSLRAKRILVSLGHFHEAGHGIEHEIAIFTVAAGTQIPLLDRMLPTEFQPNRYKDYHALAMSCLSC